LSANGNPVFLDEFSVGDGTLVQSIAIPVANDGSNAGFALSGTAISEGALARSGDGRFLTLLGYNGIHTSGLPATTTATINRVVARISATGSVDTSTRVTALYSAQNARSAVTNDGSRYWLTGSGSGVGTITHGATSGGTAVSTTVLNLRNLQIRDGNLFYSTGSGVSTRGLSQVGSGLPIDSGTVSTRFVAAQAPAPLSPYAFFWLDDSTILVADDTPAIAGGGLCRWTFDGTNWILSNTYNTGIASTADSQIRGVVATGSPTTFTAWVTASDGIYKVDVVSTVGGSFTSVATAATNTAFRGLAFAPTLPPAPSAPSAPVLAPASDSGVVGDGITSQRQPTITGTAGADLDIEIYLGASLAGSTTSNGTGDWSFTFPSDLSDGTYSITAVAVDEDLQPSSASAALLLTVDGTAPATSPGSVSALHVGAGLSIPFTASDASGSGVASTSLLVKAPSSGSFVASGLTPNSSAFSFTAVESGIHEFQLVSTDVAGNAEAKAEGDASVVINTVANGALTLPVPAGANVIITWPMTAAINVVLQFASVSTPGTVTVERLIAPSTPPTLIADYLTGQAIRITNGGVGFTTAELTLGYDAALFGPSVTPATLNTVFRVSGPDVTPFAATVNEAASTLTVSGITGFSDWYPANSQASSVADWWALEE
jgi:hypothetical protein